MRGEPGPDAKIAGTKRSHLSHLPYYLTAVVCHLGATLSSGSAAGREEEGGRKGGRQIRSLSP